MRPKGSAAVLLACPRQDPSRSIFSRFGGDGHRTVGALCKIVPTGRQMVARRSSCQGPLQSVEQFGDYVLFQGWQRVKTYCDMDSPLPSSPGQEWANWFEGPAISREGDGVTLLTCAVDHVDEQGGRS